MTIICELNCTKPEQLPWYFCLESTEQGKHETMFLPLLLLTHHVARCISPYFFLVFVEPHWWVVTYTVTGFHSTYSAPQYHLPLKAFANEQVLQMNTWSEIGFINRCFIQSEQRIVVYVHNRKTVNTSSNLKDAQTCQSCHIIGDNEPVKLRFRPWILCLEQFKTDFGKF